MHPHVSTTAKVPSVDVDILRGLLDLEYETVAAYEAGIPLLDSATAVDAQQFLRHELSHVGEMFGLIKQAGIKKPPGPRGSYDLGHPRTPAEVLDLLHRLEQAQLSAYLHAIPLLVSGPVRVAVASVFANDAQHVTVLRERLHRTPAPAAFVTGRE
ncbi:MAG: hypothetical protein QOG59_1429 [Solirubrobacteraceae bacterium]|nr:hypothetical protein [Solirubrobacteraceae bacterium]